MWLHISNDSVDGEGEEAYKSWYIEEVDKGVDSFIHSDIVY